MKTRITALLRKLFPPPAPKPSPSEDPFQTVRFVRLKPHPGEDCFRCNGPVNNQPEGPNYIYCPVCRVTIWIEQTKTRQELLAAHSPPAKP